jgi:hypothetical protein
LYYPEFEFRKRARHSLSRKPLKSEKNNKIGKE